MLKPDITQPRPQLMYGRIVYWLSIGAALICTIAPILVVAFPRKNVLDPYSVFSNIWAGKKSEDIWREGSQGFQGGHFWMHNLTSGDALIQIGIVLGCCCAGIGLLAACLTFLREKPRSVGWAIAAFTIALFIALATLGLYQQDA